MLRKFTPILLILAVIWIGCEEENDSNPITPVETFHSIYVVNSLGQTVSMVDLDADTVYNDLYTVGQFPAGIAFKDDNLYVLNSGDNTLQIIGIFGGEKIIELGDDRNPAFIEFLDGNIAAVSSWVAGTMSFVDLSADSVINEIWVGNGPWGLTSYNDKLYVGYSNYDPSTYSYGQGYVALVENQALTDSIAVGTNPALLFMDTQNEVNVICSGNYVTEFGEVWTIDPSSFTVTDNFDIGKNPAQSAINSSGRVYIAAGGALDASWNPIEGYVLIYDSITETIINGDANPLVIDEPTSILGIALDSEESIYVSSFNTDEVLKIDEEGNILQRYNVGDGPERLLYVETVVY